ncbi:MAG: cupin [Janthinobacterium lividum]
MLKMNRRQFGAGLAALGLGSAVKAEQRPEVEKLQLSRNGWMPNNERLPVLHYRRAISSGEVASMMEETFQRNQWPAQWRNGIYSFHHYHSTAHEVLGFAAGSAQLILGGEGGHNVLVESGDVLVLPAGTGHFLLHAEPGFLVVGAYPVGQHWDICRSAPDATAIERMRTLYFPQSDPLAGKEGELVHAWSAL